MEVRRIFGDLCPRPCDKIKSMPRKVRELIADLRKAGFSLVPGKGSHRKFVHQSYPGAVTLSGKPSADAKIYQERQVARAIEIIHEGH